MINTVFYVLKYNKKISVYFEDTIKNKQKKKYNDVFMYLLMINQDGKDKAKDLRSRGLCLVPVSCTQHVGNENGADYWAPAYGSGF